MLHLNCYSRRNEKLKFSYCFCLQPGTPAHTPAPGANSAAAPKTFYCQNCTKKKKKLVIPAFRASRLSPEVCGLRGGSASCVWCFRPRRHSTRSEHGPSTNQLQAAHGDAFLQADVTFPVTRFQTPNIRPEDLLMDHNKQRQLAGKRGSSFCKQMTRKTSVTEKGFDLLTVICYQFMDGVWK